MRAEKQRKVASYNIPVLQLPVGPPDPSHTKLLLSLELLSRRVGRREGRLSLLRAEVDLAFLRRRSVGNSLGGGGHREVTSEENEGKSQTSRNKTQVS